MTTIILILAVLIAVGLVIAPIMYTQLRKQRRQQKNYERSLKMVPLLIHLPPPSDDIDANGRDVRDVVDETISKAQTIYNIIASTLKKGYKSQYYGQRHFAFEIVGSQGFIYYYASVPIALADVVRQAVSSAYPTARLEEVAEHNIFNKVGGLNATLGGELHLKESYAYPIATYQDLKRDAMQVLLNSLASLGKEDGAAIQILMRPADPGWRKVASGVASKKRKGGKESKGPEQVGDWVKSFGTALVKPPEHNAKEGDAPKNELSNHEQSTLDSIDDKTRYAGFETLIRVVVSSNVSQQSRTIMNNIVASFAIYDAPGKNGFKFTAAKDPNKLATDYIMRIFPPEKKKDILNAVELATLFHFPDQSNIPTSQLVRQDSKQVDGPRNIPEEGMLLGYNMFRGSQKAIRLSLPDRQRHMYVVGQTGTGKSTYLENLALQDMINGNGFAFVDPHGDTAEKLLSMVPKERAEDLIYFSPADMDYPMGLNLFEYNSPDQKDFLIQEALNMLYKLYDPQHQGIMGPRYEHLFRNAALTVMADPAGGTFIDIPKLFRDPKYVQQKLQYVKDLNVLEFWQKEMPQSQRSNEFGEVVSWFVSKFGAFLSNEMMRNIIGQNKSAFDLRDIMDNKKILLVNLSKGRLGELNAKLLGMMFVMKIQAAAMSRATITESERVDFSLYVDEFQNFSTDSFATIMSEARKYHLNLIVANQFTTQLTDEIRDAVFGNMGTIVSFRIGQNDVESLSRYFQPTFDGDDLLRVPNYNTIIRTLVNGVPTNPFSMATLPPLGSPNDKVASALKQLSAAKYGRPKAIVESEIFARLATKDEAPTGFAAASMPQVQSAQQRPPVSQVASTVSPSNVTPTGGSSFLDDWLQKRPVAGVPSAQVTPRVTGAMTPVAASVDPFRERGQQQASAAALPPLPHDARNISSDELDQQEVTRIADELKQGIGVNPMATAAAPPIGTQDANVLPPQLSKLQATPPSDDTIVIDHDGNLHQNASND